MRLNFLSIGAGGRALTPSGGSAKADLMAELLALERLINTLVHDAVVAHGGSISAGRGLGALRRDEAARWSAPVEHALTRQEMAAVNSWGLMNPGKVLPLHRSAHAH